MAQLKDTVVAGSLRATDTLYSTTAQFQILRAPTSSNGTTFGPGSANNLLKSNGTSVYWTTLAASDIPNLSTDKLTSGTLSADRLATSGATAGSYGDSSAQMPGYGSTFKVPYVTVDNKGRVTAISDHTVKIPASDNTWRPVSDSVSSTSSSDAASSKAVKTAYDLAASKTANTGTVTSVATGVGLTGGNITGSGTLKAKLRSETALTIDSAAATTTSGRVYPIAVDKTGYLAVNVPWVSYSNATTSAAGLMSAADKTKSDSIEIATLSEVKSYLGIS